MEATATSDEAKTVTCGECQTENRAGSSFCKACGGAIAAPPACPKCEAEVPADAKFCSECGAKLVGARPEVAPAPEPTPKAAKTKPRSTVAEEAKKLPPARAKPTSNIGSNLLFFVAILMAIIVVIYVMNKDQPKSVSPFAGGPAPGAAAMKGRPPPSGGGAPAAAAQGAVKGTIRLSESLKNEGNGTIYLIVRNKGMPNAGPPVAAKKIDASSFPVAFDVSAADVMMPNMPFAGPFDLYARLDRDGNAMTKQPGDVVNEKPVSGNVGDESVEIVLDKRL